MKNLLLVFAVLFILFSIIVIAQNETNVTDSSGNVTAPASNVSAQPPAVHPASNATKQPAVQKAAEPTCGNGKVDAGENCVSCAKDVRCQSGQMCNTKTGVCESQADFTTYIIIGVGIIVLAGLFVFSRKLMKKRETLQDTALKAQPMKPQIAMPPNVSQTLPSSNQQQPAALQAQKAQPANQQPPSTIQNLQTTNQSPLPAEPAPLTQGTMPSPGQMPEQKQEEKPAETQGMPATEMPDEYNEHPGETVQQRFIRQMREKGWNDEEIRMKLKESGWSETQIALEFLKAPKFVKKH